MKVFGCILMMTCLFLRPSDAAQAARDAIRIWGMDVVPSLFPYMVLCKTAAAQMKRTRLPASFVVVLLGLVGGSPSGAAALSEYAPCCGKRKRAALCAMTGTLSPMFLYHTLGAWFPDFSFRLRMLAAHLSGAFLCAALTYILMSGAEPKRITPPAKTSDEGPVAQSLHAVLNVGGCIVFFSVAASVIGALLPCLPESSEAILHALLEVAGGLRRLAEHAPSPALCAGLAGFGGVSILAQNLYFLKPLGVDAQSIVRFALLRGLCCAGMMQIFEALSHFR